MINNVYLLFGFVAGYILGAGLIIVWFKMKLTWREIAALILLVIGAFVSCAIGIASLK